jgi:micrococcal nuclease
MIGPKTKRLIAAGLGALICLLVPALVGAAPASKAPRAASFTATIAYAVDGDTLRIREADGDLAYVRLIGIDSPESVEPDTPVECGGKQASESMEEMAPEGATVRLVFDGEREDKYGRTLAHAYVNGRQLELAQLRRGWAMVYRYHDRTFRGLARYYALQDQAEAAGRGVWGQCGGDFHSDRG